MPNLIRNLVENKGTWSVIRFVQYNLCRIFNALLIANRQFTYVIHKWFILKIDSFQRKTKTASSINSARQLCSAHKNEFCVRFEQHLAQGRFWIFPKTKIGTRLKLKRFIYNEFNTIDKWKWTGNGAFVSPSWTSSWFDYYRLYVRYSYHRRKCLSLHHDLPRSLPMFTHTVRIPYREPISRGFFHGNCQLP